MTSKFNLSALDSRCDRILRNTRATKPSYAFRGQDTKPPSLMTNDKFVAPPITNVYTGSAMIGIATLHKSNAVPIFQGQDAKDISAMRR